MSAVCRACGYNAGFEARVCPRCGEGGPQGGAGPVTPGLRGGLAPTVAEGFTRAAGGQPGGGQTVIAGEATHAGRGRAAGRACFMVTAGPDRGRQFMLGDNAYVGRDRDCGVSLNDSRVSGRHAHLKLAAGHYVYTDLQATNGSYLVLHGRRERLRGPHTLSDNDEIELGATVLRFIQFEGRPRR